MRRSGPASVAGVRPIVGLFAAAAVLLVASAVALTGGSAPKPGPTAKKRRRCIGTPRSRRSEHQRWTTALVIHRDPTDKASCSGGREHPTRSG